MRSLFLVLVLANLLLFAAQFEVVRELMPETRPAPRPPQLNAQRLRVIRDTSLLPRPAPAPQAAPSP